MVLAGQPLPFGHPSHEMPMGLNTASLGRRSALAGRVQYGPRDTASNGTEATAGHGVVVTA
jgi:hypothetical protein